jgi:hypothetical protein
MWRGPPGLIFGGPGCLIPARMKVILAFPLTLALLSQGGPCRKASMDNAPGQKVQSAEAGTSWGGRHARADVEAEGVSFEFDCAHGSADGPLAPAPDGRFDLKGYFVAERGGPVRAGQKEKRQPARYGGRIEGETMTLTVTLTESGEEIGTFTLRRGQPAGLTKCL